MMSREIQRRVLERVYSGHSDRGVHPASGIALLDVHGEALSPVIMSANGKDKWHDLAVTWVKSGETEKMNLRALVDE